MSYATKQRHYVYEYFLQSGKRSRQYIQAPSIQQAKQQLHNKSIYPIYIKRTYRLWQKHKKLSKQQLMVMTYHLQQAMQAHLTLPQVLSLLYHKEKQALCKQLLRHMMQTVEHGDPLSVAISQHPNYFPNDYQACIRAGEAHGNLAQALQQAHANLKAHCDLIKSIKKALTYPIIITILATGILTAMMLFVIPQFSNMYQQLGSTLPLPTQILIQLTHLCLNYTPICLGIILLISSLFKICLTRSNSFKLLWQRRCLKLPVIGKIIRQRFFIQWCRIVGTLLHAGIPITQAMDQAKQATTYDYFQQQLQLCAMHIEQGLLLSKSLTNIDFINTDVQLYIDMGEQNGQLAAALTQQAQQQQLALTEKLTQMTRLLEPLIMVILAGVLGSLLIVLYLPLFNLGRLF